MFFTIRRVSEVAPIDELTIGHFLFNNTTTKFTKNAKYVRVIIEKSKTNQTKKEQFAIITHTCPSLCALCEFIKLRAFTKRAPDSFKILQTRENKKITTDTIRKKLKTLCEKAKIRYKTPHGFRKGGTFHAIDENKPFHIIMGQAGWSSVRTLFKYLNNHSAQSRFLALKMNKNEDKYKAEILCQENNNKNYNK